MGWFEQFCNDLDLTPSQREKLKALIVCTNCNGTGHYSYSDRTVVCWICNGHCRVWPSYMPDPLPVHGRYRRNPVPRSK